MRFIYTLAFCIILSAVVTAGGDEPEEDDEGGDAGDVDSVAAAIAGLGNVFGSDCNIELHKQKEETCCHAPGVGSSPDAPHECFAPTADDTALASDHPQYNTAMSSALHEVTPDELEKLLADNSAMNKHRRASERAKAQRKGGAVKDEPQPLPLLVVDTRCDNDYAAGHISGTVFGGLSDMFEKWMGVVHSHHNVKIIFVSASDADVGETTARFVKAGFTNIVGHLKISAWTAARKPLQRLTRWTPADLAHSVAKESQALIDLREPCASDSATLPRAESIPLSETVLIELYHRAVHEASPASPLVVFCSSGYRSMLVVSALKVLDPDLNIVDVSAGYDDIIKNEDIMKALQKK